MAVGLVVYVATAFTAAEYSTRLVYRVVVVVAGAGSDKSHYIFIAKRSSGRTYRDND